MKVLSMARLGILLLAAAGWLAASPLLADSWPRFRGPNGTGVSDLKGLPTVWTEDDYEWVLELPGLGHSSPVVWDEALFITTGQADGTRTLHRFHALTGEEVWSQSIRLGAPQVHGKNSLATSTPALDGERVYVVFADTDQQLLLAYTFDGEEIWRHDFGPYNSQHGLGVSPIVYRDLVIFPNEQTGPSAVTALNRLTGEVVWTHPLVVKEVSYSTPIVIEPEGRSPQLICLGEPEGVIALDPLTGEQIWSSGPMPQRTVSSPVYGNGLVIASSGAGGVGKYMRAVDPTGRGDVSQTHIRYERHERDFLHYVPTPIVHGEHLYLWCDRGIVCCVEMSSGKTVWRERIGGNYSCSPVLVDGKLYCASEEGEIVVLAASPEFHEYGRSPLGDGTHASPAVANGRIYFRGFQRLVCLKARPVARTAGGGE